MVEVDALGAGGVMAEAADAKGCSGRDRGGRCVDERAAYADADKGLGSVRRVEAGKMKKVVDDGVLGKEERLMRTFVNGYLCSG